MGKIHTETFFLSFVLFFFPQDNAEINKDNEGHTKKDW